MDPRENPYTPNAGAKPPALEGRGAQLKAFELLIERLGRGHVEQSMIVTGLRGVGKTVLLGAFRDKALEHGWQAVEAEITKNSEFGPKMAALVRRVLLQMDRKTRNNDRIQRALSVLKAFTVTVSPDGGFSAGLNVDAAAGLADTGDLADDLTDLLVALGEAAQAAGTGVVFLFDEVQFMTAVELEALIAALHKTVQRALPVTFVGAGLPLIPRLAGEAKSYAERLFEFPQIGELSRTAAAAALVEPAQDLGVDYEPEAVAFILDYTQGYPYFLQEFGKILWDTASQSPFTLDDVEIVVPLVEAKLDSSFFKVRAERTTDLELQYLRAMAELGPQSHKASDVAQVMMRRSEQLGPTRARLIDKGLLYTPGHGLAAFTVPQFDRYMVRTHPLSITPPATRKKKARKDDTQNP